MRQKDPGGARCHGCASFAWLCCAWLCGLVALWYVMRTCWVFFSPMPAQTGFRLACPGRIRAGERAGRSGSARLARPRYAAVRRFRNPADIRTSAERQRRP
ncbi:hypothetical protein STXM2123_4472 [Streptomyces sp. F-3]|nr:hypothetical protein STXM2123_4472 [Streptomyces sp. F-3]